MMNSYLVIQYLLIGLLILTSVGVLASLNCRTSDKTLWIMVVLFVGLPFLIFFNYQYAASQTKYVTSTVETYTVTSDETDKIDFKTNAVLVKDQWYTIDEIKNKSHDADTLIYQIEVINKVAKPGKYTIHTIKPTQQKIVVTILAE